MRRFSKTVGSKVGDALQAGVLIENFAENHERYNNWEYKWKADAMDAGGAVISTGAGATVSSLYGPIAGIGAGIYVSGRVNSYIEEEKIKMDKQGKGETRKRGESK